MSQLRIFSVLIRKKVVLAVQMTGKNAQGPKSPKTGQNRPKQPVSPAENPRKSANSGPDFFPRKVWKILPLIDYKHYGYQTKKMKKKSEKILPKSPVGHPGTWANFRPILGQFLAEFWANFGSILGSRRFSQLVHSSPNQRV